MKATIGPPQFERDQRIHFVNPADQGGPVPACGSALRFVDDPTRSREIMARMPAGRWGTPDDLKGAVVYLASPAAACVHGTTLAVDGGWLSR